MVLVNKSHEFFEAVLGLESLLLSLSMTLSLLGVHLMLILITILSFIEADLDLLLNQWQQAHQMQEISGFTPIYEDLAVVVNQDLSVAQVLGEMEQAGRPLLKQVTLFDVYTGEQVAADKKSLAFALTFQASDRTLQDKDVQKIRQKIVRRLEQACDAQLRS